MAIEETVVLGFVAAWLLGLFTPQILRVALRLANYEQKSNSRKPGRPKKKEEDQEKP